MRSINSFAGTIGSGSQEDYETYYDSNHNSETNKINKSVVTRANSTAYTSGQVIRTIATPPADGTAGDFLYFATNNGTSAGSPPSYTTTLGGTTTDGTVVVKAFRSPYSYYRMLRTNPTLTYAPYANVHTSAAEYQYCKASNMGSALGSRAGVGISDEAAGF